VGRGYDDGVLTAIHVLEMLDRNPGKSMGDLYADLPKTWGSPTMSPHCADEVKYRIVDEITEQVKAMHARGEKLIGQSIVDVVTVNGVRVMVEDGTWGLVRLQQARACRRCGEPGFRSQHARHVQGGRRHHSREQGSRRIQPDDLTRHAE